MTRKIAVIFLSLVLLLIVLGCAKQPDVTIPTTVDSVAEPVAPEEVIDVEASISEVEQLDADLDISELDTLDADLAELETLAFE